MTCSLCSRTTEDSLLVKGQLHPSRGGRAEERGAKRRERVQTEGSMFVYSLWTRPTGFPREGVGSERDMTVSVWELCQDYSVFRLNVKRPIALWIHQVRF